jgi:chromosome segregation ATPase
MSVSKEKYDDLKKTCEAWRKIAQKYEVDLGNISEQINKLEENTHELQRENRHLKNKYKDRIAELEREKLLADNRNQQLQETCQDLRERMQDLKQDIRFYQSVKEKN